MLIGNEIMNAAEATMVLFIMSLVLMLRFFFLWGYLISYLWLLIKALMKSNLVYIGRIIYLRDW